jgi:hypothetical protein
MLGFGVWFGFIYPKSPLHDGWNPFTPLNIKDPFTPLTTWKLRNALGDTQSCLAALDTGASAERVEDHVETAQCHIRPQVRLNGVGSARLKPLNTRCQTALRLAMWERQGIQPAAQRHLGQSIAQINHLSSYNCRQIRTLQSGRARMSTHATADAVDIAGFVTASGAQITLLKNWTGPAPEAAFLKDVRDSACTWFRVTLGPDYNALHADHFHLQHTGWGLCR